MDRWTTLFAATELETLLFTVIGIMGTAISVVWVRSNQTTANHFKTLENLVGDLKTRVTNLENDKATLAAQVATLTAANTGLRTQLLILNSAHDSSPFPQWIKDKDGKVIAVNNAYEAFFLAPRGYKMEDYLHHFDKDVWPDDIAAAFDQNDRKVWMLEQIIDVKEPIENADGSRGEIRVVKFPRYASGMTKEPIGIAGVAIPDSLAHLGIKVLEMTS